MNYRDAYTRLARMISNNVPRPQLVKYLNRCEAELGGDGDADAVAKILSGVERVYGSVKTTIRSKKARQGRIVAVCAMLAAGVTKRHISTLTRWNERNIYKLLGDAKQSDHMVARMVLDDIEGDL